MGKDISGPVVRGYEAESLFGVKPFHCACRPARCPLELFISPHAFTAPAARKVSPAAPQPTVPALGAQELLPSKGIWDRRRTGCPRAWGQTSGFSAVDLFLAYAGRVFPPSLNYHACVLEMGLMRPLGHRRIVLWPSPGPRCLSRGEERIKAVSVLRKPDIGWLRGRCCRTRLVARCGTVDK